MRAMMSTAAELAPLPKPGKGGGTCVSCRRAQAFAVVFGGDFLALPVHAGGALVVDLHAVHADVALAGFRVAGDDAWQGDEAACILRPALQDGKVEQREVDRVG